VDDHKNDQAFVSLLFKRHLDSSTILSFSFASSLSEAKKYLDKDHFHVITLDGLMGLEFGYNLIPAIQQSQSHKATIIMISDNGDSIKKGINQGAHFGFLKAEVKAPVKFNEKFELIPIQSFQVV
jgi:response regulator of citrate/malate metabolism